jgi:hypothetical protein
MDPPPSRRDHALEELRIKLRVIEGKRAEELERLRALEIQVREADDLKREHSVMQSAFTLLLPVIVCAESLTATLPLPPRRQSSDDKRRPLARAPGRKAARSRQRLTREAAERALFPARGCDA